MKMEFRRDDNGQPGELIPEGELVGPERAWITAESAQCELARLLTQMYTAGAYVDDVKRAFEEFATNVDWTAIADEMSAALGSIAAAPELTPREKAQQRSRADVREKRRELRRRKGRL